ncbi:hypothetical protein N0V88_004389 [Collariella sp. IMI 366227]|nr:hypothetical protein N0V88_004389 [Collariella sp. IMI 366227]
MIPLLREVMKAHPEANALCAGAILSTYQRTRVESVAVRLGLTPLAYLWKFPVLPTPGGTGLDAQLLDDMAAVGMEARIIKVASGGLDEEFLWTNVASYVGKNRVVRAMRRFGSAETGAVIGEGEMRHRLAQHSLPHSSILSATVLLRRMSDFPTINSIYAALFDAPNPPSRVTVSCGDSLPPSLDIAVSLTVHTGLESAGDRQGLHVQSRSYWAPANIGPYSQAISIPIFSLGSSSNSTDGGASSSGGPRLVSIAGQIPLIPATMALPADGEDSLTLQLTLSLQHLWRIGVEMDVQWWTSAVAYFPRSEFSDEMVAKAKLAGRAWKAAHAGKSEGDDDVEDDESGPDLWDRRYNPEYMSYAGGEGEGKKERRIPDREVLAASSSQLAVGRVIPPLFIAEVEELPRGRGWSGTPIWGLRRLRKAVWW